MTRYGWSHRYVALVGEGAGSDREGEVMVAGEELKGQIPPYCVIAAGEEEDRVGGVVEVILWVASSKRIIL